MRMEVPGVPVSGAIPQSELAKFCRKHSCVMIGCRGVVKKPGVNRKCDKCTAEAKEHQRLRERRCAVKGCKKQWVTAAYSGLCAEHLEDGEDESAEENVV